MKRLLFLVTLILVFVCAGIAQANFINSTSLYDLVYNGETIIAGDKLFDQWWYGSPDNGNGFNNFNGVDINNILVTPLHDGGIDPGPGLLFDVINDALTVVGPGEIDFYLGFMVSTLSWLTNIHN